jgi:hypothetical protein
MKEGSMELVKLFRGSKTYILVACGLVVAGLHLSGMISDEAANTSLTVLGFGGLATLRAGISNALAQAKASGTVTASGQAKPE